MSGCQRPMPMLLLAVLAAITVPVAVHAAPDAAAVQKAKAAAAEAKAAYLARDYDNAEALYAEALRNFEHENLYFMYGRTLEQLAQFKAAALAFTRAAEKMAVGPERTVAQARAAADGKLDEAQQALADGQPAIAQPAARTAHTVLFAHSRRADDGQIYPEPAAVILLLARIELALGNASAAQQMLVEVRADPTAPQKVVDRARELAGTAPPVVEPAKSVLPPVVAPMPTPAPPPVEVAKPTPPPPVAVQKPAPVPPRPVVVPAPAVRAAPAPSRPVAAWTALAVTAALTVGGGAWWAMSVAEASDVQAKLDTAKASGKPVEGLSQEDYAAKKTELDSSYRLASTATFVGLAGMAGSAAWLVMAEPSKPTVSAVSLPDGGWGVVLAGRWR